MAWAGRWSAGSGVLARLDAGPLDAVPAAVEAVACFGVAEALANAARHGRPTGADVHVRHTGPG
ncbi:hypothetical protein AGRA3207_007097 [Actinomadura graeca]|uniref:ATP-binding protein n=1 Tax=Actinomadura graeca TaxID=2750812 RepID=A0ABX8R3B7_9ACTN|nr:hypothetical protein [Actinomadura graeca]QXJ25581.1 hypothetical protein AGRA3207_007097 [Actinomadura graeca]